ncbi:hypothetical protein BJ742DRAFT_213609 [Cladochytrium replicatum]|nr:hypothetical protein BJ742DRAFT_213609 [Cladochytrium replicatum]
MATNKKARRFEDLTFSDVLTRELPGDPLTPSGPSVPPWAVMQAPHIFTRPATITSPDTQSPGPAGTNNFFDSSITQAASPDAVVRSVRRVAGAFYTYIYPEPLPTPTLCAWSPSAFALLDLQGPPSLNEVKHDVHAQYRRYVMAQMLSGSKILQGCLPYAANYGGHQFGYYAGQLGDGRCVSLGRVFMPPAKEIVGAGVAAGEKESAGARFSWEMNVKGAGRTPYSRFGDGYQILSAGIREFLGSETLAALGIPTTRSLALIGSSRPLKRDDNATPQSASAVARLAPSWIRFGTFELSHYRSEKTMVRALANYLLQHHFPEIDARYGSAIVSDPATSRSTSPQGKAVKLPKITVVRTIDFDESATNVKVMVEGAATMEAEMNRYAMLFGEIVKRSAVMVAHWQAQGFCHGVLNTDNMSVLGITIDFGPFGFLDSYDPLWTANISDSDGKYAFAKQPHTVLDNLSKLGRVFVELVEIPANQAEILEPVSLSSSLNGGNLSGLPRLSTAHPRSSTAGPRLSAPGTRVSTAVGQAAGTEVGRTPKTPGSSLLAEPGGLSRPKPKGSEIIKAILDTYESRFIDEYSAIMRKVQTVNLC